MEGMGKEKLSLALLKVAKHLKGPLRQSVDQRLTNFVANVTNLQMHQYIDFFLLISKNSSFLRTREKIGQTFIYHCISGKRRPFKRNPDGGRS